MRRVLVVDDNDINRKLAATVLKRRGWQVREAENGPQALELLQVEAFDYVLLDIGMPGMDGCEVCRRIRESFTSEALRVVAYTAHALETERERIMAAGFDDIITKPVSVERLNAMFPD